METKLETVTPSMAQTWLQNFNPAGNNRNFRPEWMKKLSEYITKGKWQASHQGIAFGKDNNLIDGQHRLAAIVDANIAVEILVTRGLPLEARPFVDTNRPRTDADAMKIEGMEATTRSVATARCMHEAAHGFRAGRAYNSLDRTELMTYHARHAPAIMFSHALVARKIMGALTSAAVARATYTSDRERLQAFIRVMNTGIMEEGEADTSAILLRNAMIQDAKKISREDEYYRTSSGLRHFLDRKPIGALRITKREQFPVPGENNVTGQ